MKKLMVGAFITQHCGNRHDKIWRRIWEDDAGRLFVKVNGDWIPLLYYKRNPDYTVDVG